MIDADRLRKLLHYNAETGAFTWLVSPVNGTPAGKTAGYLDGRHHGYWHIVIGNRRFAAHQLAWLYVHGEWPRTQIDHINGVRHDNRIVNLRLATRSENSANSKRRSDNTCGLKGVSFHRQHRRWRAQIMKNGKHIALGYFDTPDEAHRAYCLAAASLFGEFARSQ